MLHLLKKHILLEHAKIKAMLAEASSETEEAGILIRLDLIEDAGIAVNEAIEKLAEAQSIVPTMVVAELCHEVNRAYCNALDDHTQPSFENIPEWQLSSILSGIAKGPQSPGASHESWLQHKVEEGWKYGPTKDAEKKTHPSMKPFKELHYKERAKDFIFQAIIGVCHETNPNNDVPAEQTESTDN